MTFKTIVFVLILNNFSIIQTFHGETNDIVYPEDSGFFPHDFVRRTYEHGKAVLKHALLLDLDYTDTDEVKFYLLTRLNEKKTQRLIANNLTSIDQSNFMKNGSTVFIIHGWNDNTEHDIFTYMSNELLQAENLNIILVDWRHQSAQLYPVAAQSVQQMSALVKRFIDFLLRENYLQYKDIHLIGHSLGAQISGIVGHRFKGQIFRITGLDPAGPLFEFWDPNPDVHNLDQGDARFVDIIHTSCDDFGITNPMGHVDFYPNEGTTPQAGCDSLIAMVSCSHVRAVQYYTESVNTKVGFWSTPCSGWMPFVMDECKNKTRVLMGHWTPITTRGSYYLKTKSKAPYALG
ncbi:pancreatic lipase-related protein 2-like [Chrysoperla carnea]|uniref:pancreatic lipase-related protein 2-like n=1 Tax=Chrysoperla carnea TaxID=189513 RepID=UPI001D07CE40|nr:pancreatic lipase-related protein 2-like [Chrysoperla carnea]